MQIDDRSYGECHQIAGCGAQDSSAVFSDRKDLGYPIPKVPWDDIGMGSWGGSYHPTQTVWNHDDRLSLIWLAHTRYS